MALWAISMTRTPMAIEKAIMDRCNTSFMSRSNLPNLSSCARRDLDWSVVDLSFMGYELLSKNRAVSGLFSSGTIPSAIRQWQVRM